jgi:ABC-2 type transport system permease protein
MMRDVLTVMWKEWRDMPFLRGGLKGGIIGQLLMMGIMGIFLPYSIGRDFVTGGGAVFLAAWIPMVMTMSFAADAFAGERERHTLESLLASRLSDRAIMFGKIATIVCYAWAMTMLLLLLALATVNIVHGHGKLLMYPISVGIGAPLIALLISTLLSSLGVIVSLRAATVRQAAQSLSLLFLVVFIVPVAVKVMPHAWMESLALWFGRVGMPGVIATAVGILLVLDIILLTIAAAKFKRSRLILE